MKRIISYLLLLLILCGCSTPKKVDTSKEKQDISYIIKIGNKEISINDEYVKDDLKDEIDQYEVVNCAIGNTNIVHIFDDVEITTYTENNKDIIYSIVFTKPTITSKDGIKLGLTKSEIIDILNNECAIEDSLITKDYKTYQLNIVIKDDIVVGVEYLLNN